MKMVVANLNSYNLHILIMYSCDDDDDDDDDGLVE